MSTSPTPTPTPSSSSSSQAATETARTYYNSSSADTFYRVIWGGQQISIGLYPTPSTSLPDASRLTVAHMASLLQPPPTPSTRILDMGAGYGGAARYLAKTYGCRVTCLNLSEVENERNRELCKEEGLERLVDVVEGNFENVPLEGGSFTVVWSQDAFLHSGDRAAVVGEIARLLIKSGGRVIFTDPMAAEGADQEGLRPVLERLHLESLGGLGFYRREFEKMGFQELGWEERTEDMVMHYGRVLEELEAREEELRERVDEVYVRNMKVGLKRWVDGGKDGQLCWGFLQFQR